MHFNFNYESVPLLFFLLQGLIFAALIWGKGRENRPEAARWLSTFIVLCCLYVVPWTCGHAGWYARDGYREFLFFVPFQQLFFIGPVLYFYTLSLLEPGFRSGGKKWLHFVPGGLYLLYALVAYLADAWILDEYFFYADGRDRDLDLWYQLMGFVSMTLYVGLSIKAYLQYKKRIFAELSFADTVVYHWLRRFLLALLFILVLRLVFLALYPRFGDFGSKWWYYMGFGLVYYYIALEGMLNLLGRPADLPPIGPDLSPATTLPAPATLPLQGDFSPAKERLQHLMAEQRLFENPTLTLDDLAEKMQMNRNQVSGLINQGLGKNFNDFVNEFRVEAVKERLALGDHQRFTLLSIALDCGFNSKSTFNRVFKRLSGFTPNQYLAQLPK